MFNIRKIGTILRNLAECIESSNFYHVMEDHKNIITFNSMKERCSVDYVSKTSDLTLKFTFDRNLELEKNIKKLE